MEETQRTVVNGDVDETRTGSESDHVVFLGEILKKINTCLSEYRENIRKQVNEDVTSVHSTYSSCDDNVQTTEYINVLFFEENHRMERDFLEFLCGSRITSVHLLEFSSRYGVSISGRLRKGGLTRIIV